MKSLVQEFDGDAENVIKHCGCVPEVVAEKQGCGTAKAHHQVLETEQNVTTVANFLR